MPDLNLWEIRDQNREGKRKRNKTIVAVVLLLLPRTDVCTAFLFGAVQRSRSFKKSYVVMWGYLALGSVMVRVVGEGNDERAASSSLTNASSSHCFTGILLLFEVSDPMHIFVDSISGIYFTKFDFIKLHRSIGLDRLAEDD